MPGIKFVGCSYCLPTAPPHAPDCIYDRAKRAEGALQELIRAVDEGDGVQSAIAYAEAVLERAKS